MNFISFAFLMLLVPVLVARLTIGRNGTEAPFRGLVLAASTVFVMWHVPAYILILLLSTGTDFVAAALMDREPDGSPRRKWLLGASLGFNLLLLGAFKYTNFLCESLEGAAHLLGFVWTLPRGDWTLPMGISFYTFASMSYTIDVYRRRIRPVGRFRELYYFVSFFPHMVAGPIIRAEDFLRQCTRRRRPRWIVFNAGAYLIIRGLFLKMVCADNIGSFVDQHWSSEAARGTNSLTLLGLVFLFAWQIYCDFEGYSSIARGLAYWLGIRFPINFNNPYLATSFSNFWERWHITLSKWLRDYLYYPLGGNRVSPWRTYVNLLVVMVLGGLWHGAAATFLVWGLVHGLALNVERALGLNRPDGNRSPVIRTVWYLVVQGVVLWTWVFFRSTSLAEAESFTLKLFAFQFGGTPGWLAEATLYALPPMFMHYLGWMNERGRLPKQQQAWQAVAAGVMLYAVLCCYGNSTTFIYFQF